MSGSCDGGRGRQNLRVLLDYAGAIAVVGLVWELAALAVHRSILPGPAPTLAAFARGMFTAEGLSGGLARHFLVSTYRVVVSMVIACALAVPLGLWMGRSERLDRWLAPIVYLLYPVPKVAFLPIILLFLGVYDAPKIFLIAIVVFFQILVTTRDAARQVSPQSVYSMISLGASDSQIYQYAILPACLPKIFTSLRIGLGTAVAVLFLTETFATSLGLGYFLVDSWSRLAYVDLFAGVVALGVLGFLLYLLVEWLERELTPWQFI